MNPFQHAMMMMATIKMTATTKTKNTVHQMYLHGKYAGVCTAC